MRKFLFWNEAGEEKEKEALSLKKAIMSVQSDYKDRMISVEYISKKGKQMCHGVLIPIGRKIKQALIQERRREALKAKMARQMLTGKFSIRKDNRILKFTNFDDIPSSFSHVISFEPDYPEPPHTNE